MKKLDCFCKKMIIGGIAVGAAVMPVATGVASVSGLTYQSSTDVSFTFNPVLTVSISDDLTIADLAPGTFADSNEIVVTVSTNNAYGYTLSATVGDTDNNLSSELRHSTYASSGDPVFSSIATNADLARATFSSDTTYDNKWGLATSNDGTTWGNYNGLPVTGGESAMELLSTNYTPTNGTASKYVKIGARASSTQYSGTYTNVISFVAVGGVEPAKTIATATTMQEVASKTDGGCPASLTTDQVYTLDDTRGSITTTYRVARLADGNCWMLDNLALDLTNSTLLSALSESNTNASNTTLGYLKGTTTGTTSDKYATAAVANWNSYSYSIPLVNMGSKDTVPQGNDDPLKAEALAGNWKVGGYYNYCAASAGSYCYGDNGNAGTSSGNATEDICPKGWRLPTGDDNGDFIALTTAITGSSSHPSTSNGGYNPVRTALRLPLSGSFHFDGSALHQGSDGYLWSSTRYDDSRMHFLHADTSDIYLGNYVIFRCYGYSIRCVLGS